MERILEPALECGEVDMDETEPSAVPEGPLEIVEQRPDEVTPNRYARLDRIEHGAEIAAQKGDPLFIADPSVRIDPVSESSAVFEDIDRQITCVAFLRFDHHLAECVGRDLPAHFGDRRPRLAQNVADLERVVRVAMHS